MRALTKNYHLSIRARVALLVYYFSSPTFDARLGRQSSCPLALSFESPKAIYPTINRSLQYPGTKGQLTLGTGKIHFLKSAIPS